MKNMKKLLSFIFAFSLIFSMSICSLAAVGDSSFVIDYADKLSEQEETNLDNTLISFKNYFNAALFVVTKYGYNNYTADEFGQTIYQDMLLSQGDEGLVFVDDFDNDTYALYTYGDSDIIFDSAQLSDFFGFLENSYGSDYLNGSYTAVVDYIAAEYAAYYNVADIGEGEQTTAKYDSSYDYSAPESYGKQITDDAGLLTDTEEANLLEKIEAIRSKYNFDVVLHTTNSIGSKSIADYAYDYYDYNNYGIGSNKDGLLFMLNMNNGEEGNRDYYTSTKGSGITAFTDYAILDSDSKINSIILGFLQSGDWYAAFDNYLDLVDIFLKQAATGEPYDYANPYKSLSDYVFAEAAVIIVAIIIAFIVAVILKSKMKTNFKKHNAADYMVNGSFNLTGGSDIFSRTEVQKVARPKETSSSGSSGSSTHTSSSGSSHGGGGGKF